MIEIARGRESVSFVVRLQPGARQQGVAGEHGGALKVAVTAPPEAGKANRALIDLLSEVLEVPKSAIEIVSGHTSRRKRIRVACEQLDLVVTRLRAQGG